MSHHIARSHRVAFAVRLALAVQVLLVATLGFSLSTAAAPAAAAEEGPCGANPCGPVPANQGPCGANPCGPVPANQGPCGANPCATNVPADPNADRGPTGTAAPISTVPAPVPDPSASTTTTTTAAAAARGQAEEATPAVPANKASDAGGGVGGWVVAGAIVVLLGALAVWLVRRRAQPGPSV